MKRRNNFLFCCSLIATLFLVAPSHNFDVNATAENFQNNVESQFVSSRSLSFKSNSNVAAATLTYDFRNIKNGSYDAFDVATWNKLDDNGVDYITDVESYKTYYGDSSQATETGIKFGNSSTPGTLTLKFKTNVKSVKLYVTKYKTYDSAFVINGGEKVLLEPNQGQEPQLIEYTPTEKSKTLTITTSDETYNGYKLLRAWMKQLIVEVEAGEYIPDVTVKSFTCSSSYRLNVGKVLRLQAFDGSKVVNGTQWSIVSGEEYATLFNGRLKGIKYGITVVQGTYEGFDPIYMKVRIGSAPVVSEFKSVSNLRECFTASSSSITINSENYGVSYETYGKVIGFASGSATEKNFYINDGSSTILVTNTLYSHEKIKIDSNIYLTGKLDATSKKPSFKANDIKLTTNSLDVNLTSLDITSYAEYAAISTSYAAKLHNMYSLVDVEARFDSLNNDGSANIFFTDDPTKIVKLLNATSFISEKSISNFEKGCDIAFNAIYTIGTTGDFNYTGKSRIADYAHTFTGAITGLSLSKTTAAVAVGKTLDVAALATLTGTGDYNPNLLYASSNTAYANVNKAGLVTVYSNEALIGESVVITVTAKGDVTKTATLTINITESLKSSTIDATSLGMSAYADSTASTSFAISDDTNTINVSYYQCGSYGDGIQMKISSGKKSSIYSEGAATYYISSILVRQNPAKGAKASNLIEVFGSDTAFTSTATTGTALTVGAEGMDLEYSFGANSYKYFKIQHSTTSGTMYVSSVVVSYKKV